MDRRDAERDTVEVFDILNCGPRRRFVVLGTGGPMIVHNCVQALAFAVMKWQAGGDTITRHGLVLNCHDAHAVLVPRLQAADTKASLLADMSECPPWVPGLPLGAEADVAETMAGVI